ncbi:MAG: hypothetical protein CL932_09915 [Deltaproteobacteria bacterium]|nr:hypothetical protein [Deltaproteobacteria bacterium]
MSWLSDFVMNPGDSREESVLFFLCTFVCGLVLCGCLPNVKFKNPPNGSSEKTRESFYNKHRVIRYHRGKAPIVLGSGVKFFDVQKLRPLVLETSKTAKTLEVHDIFMKQALAAGIASGGGAIISLGMLGAVLLDPTLSVDFAMAGVIGGFISVVGFGTWMIVAAFQGNTARVRALKSYNADLRKQLQLPQLRKPSSPFR